MRPIDADALGDITITINGTVFVRYEDIMNEPTIFNENDLKEIEDRFGNFVRFVIEDIMRGKEERWGDEVSENDQDIVVADEAYAEYKANPKTYTLGEIIEMNDLISRETLIEAILEARREETDTIPKLVRFIEKLPTVEPNCGRWIVKGQDIYCSVCDNESAYNPFGASKFSLYCPNCGAKMEDGNE